MTETKQQLKEVTKDKMSKVRLISGRSNPELSELVSKNLKIPLTGCKITDFNCSEIGVQILENIRGCHVWVIQTGCSYKGRSINDHLVELYAILHAAKLAGSKSLGVIMPNYAYARSDKKDVPRVPIMGSCQALIFHSLGVDHFIAMDLHAQQIQGFFQSEPLENLFGIKLHCENLKENVFKGYTKDEIEEKFVLASPDVGGAKRTEAYAKKLGLKHVIMHKHRNYQVPGTVLNSILIGEKDCVKNKTVIIIDDIADTLGSMVSASNELKENGAKEIIILVTHGVLSGPAFEKLNETDIISKCIVTNSIPQKENLQKSKKIQVVDISGLVSDAVRVITNGNGSVSELFQ